MKKQEEQEQYKDPVCGMTVSPTTAPAAGEYKGKTYYFCAEVCRDKFEAAPERYTGKWPRNGR